MWICNKCKRIFTREKQPHTCKKVPLDKHFQKKEKAKRLFDYLVNQIDTKVGTTKIVSIPCCIHLFGNYDFLATLPKKDKLEIRFISDRIIDSPRLKQCVPVSMRYYKNCFDIKEIDEINKELLGWIKESYTLKGLD